MADPQSPVGQVVSGNNESENDRSLGSYESPSDPCPVVKRNDLLAHRTMITYQKKRYLSITN
jgi:hypothetical protein